MQLSPTDISALAGSFKNLTRRPPSPHTGELHQAFITLAANIDEIVATLLKIANGWADRPQVRRTEFEDEYWSLRVLEDKIREAIAARDVRDLRAVSAETQNRARLLDGHPKLHSETVRHEARGGSTYVMIEPAKPSGEPSLESGFRAAATVTFASYALGFVVSNAYLYQFGFSDFSALRPRFIYTGFLALSLAAAFAAIAFLGVFLVRRKRYFASRWVQAAYAVGITGAAGLACLVGPYIALRVVPDVLGHSEALAPGEAGLLYATGALGAGALYAALSGARGPLPDAVAWTFAGLVGSGCLLAYGVLLAGSLYPIVPAAFGGGKPDEVQIVFSDGASGAAVLLGADPGSRSLAGERIYEDDEHIYLLTLGGRAVRLSRKDVTGLRTSVDAP